MRASVGESADGCSFHLHLHEGKEGNLKARSQRVYRISLHVVSYLLVALRVYEI